MRRVSGSVGQDRQGARRRHRAGEEAGPPGHPQGDQGRSVLQRLRARADFAAVGDARYRRAVEEDRNTGSASVAATTTAAHAYVSVENRIRSKRYPPTVGPLSSPTAHTALYRP